LAHTASIRDLTARDRLSDHLQRNMSRVVSLLELLYQHVRREVLYLPQCFRKI
jgi:hypothetical protein